MASIRFYHLEASRIADEAPKLLQKAYETGLKTIVRCVSDAAITDLDRALWRYDTASFLPHGTSADTDTAPDQPIYLTLADENPNAAKLLVLIDGADAPDAASFDRCFYMFNGNDQDVLTKARQDWKAFKDQSFDVSYWQKEPPGKWIQKV